MSKKYTTFQFIEKSILIHGNKYIYDKTIYISSLDPVIIHCSKHGDFLQLPVDHLRGRGCIDCSGKRKLTTEGFIKKAIEIHGNEYIYKNVDYKNNSTLVEIECSKHGPFLQIPLKHINGKQGCPSCYGTPKLDFDTFLKKSLEKYGDLFTYNEKKFKNAKTKTELICKNNHKIILTPSRHLEANSFTKCSLCSERKVNKIIFLQKAILLNGDKYEYFLDQYNDEDLINKQDIINIQCKKHNYVFKQSIRKHLIGNGCPKCSGNISKAETEWLDQIEKDRSIRILRQYKIPKTNYIADGFYPETNEIFEMNGDVWHGNPNRFDLNDYNPLCKKTYGELYKELLTKEAKIKELGYNLISIWYRDYLKQNKT